jgi:hypothetical protein
MLVQNNLQIMKNLLLILFMLLAKFSFAQDPDSVWFVNNMVHRHLFAQGSFGKAPYIDGSDALFLRSLRWAKAVSHFLEKLLQAICTPGVYHGCSRCKGQMDE